MILIPRHLLHHKKSIVVPFSYMYMLLRAAPHQAHWPTIYGADQLSKLTN